MQGDDAEISKGDDTEILTTRIKIQLKKVKVKISVNLSGQLGFGGCSMGPVGLQRFFRLVLHSLAEVVVGVEMGLDREHGHHQAHDQRVGQELPGHVCNF